ncbi:MAG: hypothetical protein JJP05_08500 [cyanobacterium endosymbiont of Rhopalodia gibba]
MNTLHEGEKRLVLTPERLLNAFIFYQIIYHFPIKLITDIQITDIQIPNLETHIAILQKSSI